MRGLVLLAGLAWGCSTGPATGTDGGKETGACPDDFPRECPTPIPSYKAVIAPILVTSCTACHSPSGTAGHSETTYADVYAQRESILYWVNGCAMPPSTYRPLTTEQRVALLGWLKCGAPDN